MSVCVFFEHSQKGSARFNKWVTSPIVGGSETEFGQSIDELIYFTFDSFNEKRLIYLDGDNIAVKCTH